MRRVFSNADWSELSFHDVRVHAYREFVDEREVRLDIDYLVEWQRGAMGRGSFVICPATLIFDNATITERTGNPEPFILSRIERQPRPDGTFDYELESQTGGIVGVRAIGFRLYLRGDPITSSRQVLTPSERGESTMELPH